MYIVKYLSAQEPQAEPNLARVIESVTLMTPGQCEAGLGCQFYTAYSLYEQTLFRKYVLQFEG